MKSLLVVICLIALTALASAQAAVEGALTHALSGATSATAGKALGQIENQLAGRLGQQTSNVVSPRLTAVRPGPQKSIKTATALAPTPANNGGSLIASIQGGEAQTPKACIAQNSDKTSSVQKVSDCAAKPSADADAHPSQITLPAPK